MNPDLKLVLDTMSKHFEDQDARWEKRFTEHDDKWERKFLKIDAVQDLRVSRIERAADALEQWRPEIKGSVDDLRLEVKKLNKYCERASFEASTIRWRHHFSRQHLCWYTGGDSQLAQRVPH